MVRNRGIFICNIIITMSNVHPLVIHFPIALLSLYVIIECLSLFSQKIRNMFFTSKLLLLFVGTVWTLTALRSWEAAEDILWESSLIYTHSEIAEQTYTIFVILSIIYLVYLLAGKRFIPYYKSLQEKLYTILSSRWMKICITILALYGFALLIITGSLGAAITHGPDIDPIVQFIYNLFL